MKMCAHRSKIKKNKIKRVIESNQGNIYFNIYYML